MQGKDIMDLEALMRVPYVDPDGEFTLSPEGDMVAYSWNPDGQWEVFLLPLDGSGSPRQITSGPGAKLAPRWSLKDNRIAYVLDLDGGELYDIFVYDLITGEHQNLTPDSKRVAFSSDLHDRFNIGFYEISSGQITWITKGEGDWENPIWSPDGSRLACTFSKGPSTSVVVFDIEQGTVKHYQVEPGVHYRPQFTSDGEHLAFIFDNPRHPSDLWLLSLRDGNLQRLTKSLPPSLRQTNFVIPEEVNYLSMDGMDVPALLYKVPREKRVELEEPGSLPPEVVNIHDGPNWLSQVTWDPLTQHMVSRGWTVLAPNYRGSTGFGRAWQLANRFDFGGGDTQDVVAGADYLVREGLADASHIAVTRRSYDGYLTMTSLTQYPDRWAVGSAAVPFLNWFTGHANSREDL